MTNCVTFLTSNGILYKLQSGFRKSFFIDELLLNPDKDNVTGLAMIDYKKAFDLIYVYVYASSTEAWGYWYR